MEKLPDSEKEPLPRENHRLINRRIRVLGDIGAIYLEAELVPFKDPVFRNLLILNRHHDIAKQRVEVNAGLADPSKWAAIREVLSQ